VTGDGATVDDINTANGDEGTDTLTNVEQLSFNGVTVTAAAAVNDALIGVNDTSSWSTRSSKTATQRQPATC